jgi:predicted rRNA methylase YqxC with S4 and FtsJ domains
MVALIKPQFEWVNPPSDFQGIVPDDRLDEILSALINDLKNEGVLLTDKLPSSVRGRKGNQEFLARLSRT